MELSEAEATVLDMLAKSNTPWVRRSLADLAAGGAVVDGLEAKGLVKAWVTMVVDEKRELTRKEKTTNKLTGEKVEKVRHVAWHPTRARRMAFVALTALGQARTERDVFERGDVGQVYQGYRRRHIKTRAWMLPDAPIKSSGRGIGVELCRDQTRDQGDAAKGRRAG